MARRATLQVEAVSAACDLSAARLLVDVGGGKGAMLTCLLAQYPALRGLVADRAPVAAAATTAFEEAGLGARAHGEPADFFESVPGGGDVYVLSNVLHDWDDEPAVRILRSVRAAMGEDAHLLVVETVLDAPGRSTHQQRDIHLLLLHMLVGFGA